MPATLLNDHLLYKPTADEVRLYYSTVYDGPQLSVTANTKVHGKTNFTHRRRSNRMRNEGIRAGDISKHRQNKIQFVSHPNTSLVSPFTSLLFIGYCWNWFVVRKTCLPVSLQRNRKSKTEDPIVSCKRETFTLEFTINERAKNKMFEYFACFTAHYTTTATSREVPDRESGYFLIFSLARGGGGTV